MPLRDKIASTIANALWPLVLLHVVLSPEPSPASPILTLRVDIIARWGLWFIPVALLAGAWLRQGRGEERVVEAPAALRLAASVGVWFLGFFILGDLLPEKKGLGLPFLVQLAAVLALFDAKALGEISSAAMRRGKMNLADAAAAGALLLPLLSLGFFALRETNPALTENLAFSSQFQPRRDMGEMLLAVLLIPLAEELLFRAGILEFMRRRLPLRAGLSALAAVVVSAAIFSALHFQQEIFWARFAAGLALGGLYVRAGSVGPGFLLHAAMNAAILFLPVFFGS